MRRILFLSISSVMLLTACDVHHAVSSDELKAYALNAENGLIKSITDSDVAMELVYRPKDLVLEQEADGDLERWKEAAQKLDSLDYFVLRLSRNGEEIENTYAGNPDKFSQVISYLSASIAENIYLQKEKKYYPESAILIRSYGMAGATSVLVVFKTCLYQQEGSFSVVFDDPLFGTGQNEFPFRCIDIKKTPRLRF